MTRTLTPVGRTRGRGLLTVLARPGVSIRELMAMTGLSPNGVLCPGLARTLQPTCRWIPAADLRPGPAGGTAA